MNAVKSRPAWAMREKNKHHTKRRRDRDRDRETDSKRGGEMEP